MNEVETRFKQIKETKGLDAALAWLFDYKTTDENRTFVKKLKEKLEAGGIDEILDWMNEGFRAARAGVPYEKTSSQNAMKLTPKIVRRCASLKR